MWITKFKGVMKSSDPQSALLASISEAKNSGIDQGTALDLLTELKKEVPLDYEDMILEVMDFVVGFCVPSKRIYPSV